MFDHILAYLHYTKKAFAPPGLMLASAIIASAVTAAFMPFGAGAPLTAFIFIPLNAIFIVWGLPLAGKTEKKLRWLYRYMGIFNIYMTAVWTVLCCKFIELFGAASPFSVKSVPWGVFLIICVAMITALFIIYYRTDSKIDSGYFLTHQPKNSFALSLAISFIISAPLFMIMKFVGNILASLGLFGMTFGLYDAIIYLVIGLLLFMLFTYMRSAARYLLAAKYWEYWEYIDKPAGQAAVPPTAPLSIPEPYIPRNPSVPMSPAAPITPISPAKPVASYRSQAAKRPRIEEEYKIEYKG